MGAKGSLPFSQDPATCTYPEPDQPVHPPATTNFFSDLLQYYPASYLLQ